MLKKNILYLLVFLIITLVFSYGEIACAWHGNQTCLVNLIGKFIIFMLVMFILDKFILKKTKDNHER